MSKITPKSYIGVYECDHCDTVNDAWILLEEGMPVRVLNCMGCGAPIPSGVGVFKLPPPAERKTIGQKWNHLFGKPNFKCSSCNGEIPGTDDVKCCPSCGNPKDPSDVKRKKITYGLGEEPVLKKENSYTDLFKEEELVEEGYTEKVDSYFTDKKEDYFDDNNKQSTSNIKDETVSFTKNFPKNGLLIKKKALGYSAIALGVLLFSWLIWFFFIADVEKSATLFDKTWERSINIQSYEWVTESDWNIPTGGEYISERQKHHHYEQEFVKTVTKTRTVQDRVVTGTEDYVCGTTDNGDGTFTDKICTRDVYGYEDREETYTEDIYKDVSIEKTYYTYKIQRWVHNRTRTTNGSVRNENNPEPYWYNITLAGENERVNSKPESYILTFHTTEKDGTTDDFTKSVEQSEWSIYTIDQEFVLITNRVGRVKSFTAK